MAGSNEGNEGNEGNSGSFNRGGGGGFSVLPDRLDLPFVSLGNLARQRLPRIGWRDPYWAGEWAAFLTLVDFAPKVILPYARPTSVTPKTTAMTDPGKGDVTSLGVLPYAWQAGDYKLTCVTAGTSIAPGVAGTFTLKNPQGRLLQRFTLPLGASIDIAKEIKLTITSKTVPFDEDDTFTINVLTDEKTDYATPGTNPVTLRRRTIWLSAPENFPSRLPAKVIDPVSLGPTRGRCEILRPQPTLCGVVTGKYTLTCTGVTGAPSMAQFALKRPNGTLVANYEIRAQTAGTTVFVVMIANEVQCKLSTGTTSFAAGDSFTLEVQPAPMELVITPASSGNQGSGSCSPDDTAPVPAGARIGIYRLRCTKAATVASALYTAGAEFALLDPDGNAVPGTITLSAGAATSSVAVASPLNFTITDRDLGQSGRIFAVDDGFDLDVGGFLDAELDELVRAAEDERADALGEIIAQNDGFLSYFLAAMAISPKSHPRTCLLLYIGSLVGAYVSMHFKGVYQRGRASQRAPALLPPIPVPGHPSYPSGHSTQAHLMALCALAGMPNDIRSTFRPVLLALADRIARNREIAGLHFGSDSRAGEALARQILAILASDDMPLTVPQAVPPYTSTGTTASRFGNITAAAKREWQ